MEDTLRVCLAVSKSGPPPCLNPCFNGRYSQRIAMILLLYLQRVLILVLMEDTLREVALKQYIVSDVCLNPCFNGRYSQSLLNTLITRPTLVS